MYKLDVALSSSGAQCAVRGDINKEGENDLEEMKLNTMEGK